MNKYFLISSEKERIDSDKLLSKIKEDNYITDTTVLVNCSPDYSSRLTQLLNHKLSYLNKNELFYCINMEMPYPNMSQVYYEELGKFISFDTYLKMWAEKNISSQLRYLFIDSGTLRGKNFTKVKTEIKRKLQPSNYKFASLYVQSTSIFEPDYYVEKFDKEKQGGLLFEWENSENPNWDY